MSMIRTSYLYDLIYLRKYFEIRLIGCKSEIEYTRARGKMNKIVSRLAKMTSAEFRRIEVLETFWF